MTISTLRTATDEDYDRIEKAAERFCKRHQIDFDTKFETAEQAVDQYINHVTHVYSDIEGKYYEKLWLACFRRAIRNNWADTIGYGHIGKYIK